MSPAGERRARWGVMACALIAFAGCSRTQTVRSPTAASVVATVPGPAADSDFVLREDTRGITAAPVAVEQLPDYLEIAAHIQADPRRVVRVYPPVSGRLMSVDVRPADYVRQGQVLATLASSDVAAARAAYRQAQADGELKQQALERSRLLYENHVIALREYQQARADAQTAAAAQSSAVERLELLNADTAGASDQVSVTAPRPGVVTDLQAAPGEFAKSLDNATPLCTIADLGGVWAVGDVYEKDLATVRVGEPAEVEVIAYPGETRRARIAAIASTVDTTSRTLKVRVDLANPGLRLKPDMFATIRVVRAVRTALVVPQAAVLREGPSAYVFVQVSPGRFTRRAVALGRDADGQRVEVTSGLARGDTVVVEGAELLRAAASP